MNWSTGVSDLESGFSGRLEALGQREEAEGEHRGPRACAALVAPVANAFSPPPPPRNSITCQMRKRKLLLQSTTLFKSVSCIFQLGQREMPLAREPARPSPLL